MSESADVLSLFGTHAPWEDRNERGPKRALPALRHADEFLIAAPEPPAAAPKDLLGESPAMRELWANVRRLGRGDMPVLVSAGRAARAAVVALV